MSLINDVLRDLDARERSTGGVHAIDSREIGAAGASAYGLPAGRTRFRRHAYVSFVIVVACVAIGAALLDPEREPVLTRLDATAFTPSRPATTNEASAPDTDPTSRTSQTDQTMLVESEKTGPPSLSSASSDASAESAPPARRSRSNVTLLPRYIRPLTRGLTRSLTRGSTPSHALPVASEAGTPRAPVESVALTPGDVDEAAPVAKGDAPTPPKRASTTLPETDQLSFIEVTPRVPSTEERLLMDFRAAADAYREGSRDEAERRLDDLLERDRGQHRARLLLARLHEDRGLDERAEALLSQGLSHYPRHAPYAGAYARLLARQGRDRAAITALRNALPEAHGNAELHALLAALLQRTGDPAAAARSYLAALRIDSTAGERWMGLGLSSEQAGDRETAEAAYREALRLPLSGDVERYVRLRLRELASTKRVRNGDPDEAAVES